MRTLLSIYGIESSREREPRGFIYQIAANQRSLPFVLHDTSAYLNTLESFGSKYLQKVENSSRNFIYYTVVHRVLFKIDSRRDLLEKLFSFLHSSEIYLEQTKIIYLNSLAEYIFSVFLIYRIIFTNVISLIHDTIYSPVKRIYSENQNTTKVINNGVELIKIIINYKRKIAPSFFLRF